MAGRPADRPGSIDNRVVVFENMSELRECFVVILGQHKIDNLE